VNETKTPRAQTAVSTSTSIWVAGFPATFTVSPVHPKAHTRQTVSSVARRTDTPVHSSSTSFPAFSGLSAASLRFLSFCEMPSGMLARTPAVERTTM
jgi:hypothetical protein